MSNDALNWAVTQRVTPTQKLVLLVLANRADGEWRCWPSVKKLAEETSLSERSVQYTIRALSASGVISVLLEKGRASTYTLNHTPAADAGVQLTRGCAACAGAADAGVRLTRGCAACAGATDAGVQLMRRGGAADAPGGCNPCGPTRASTKEPKEEPEGNPKNIRARKPKTEKRTFGEFQNVKLTEQEYSNLQERFPDKLPDGIELLSAHLAAKGDKYKSHYAAFFTWVIRAVDEGRVKRARASPGGGFVSPAQRRLEANREAGRRAKEMLFGKQEEGNAAAGL